MNEIEQSTKSKYDSLKSDKINRPNERLTRIWGPESGRFVYPAPCSLAPQMGRAAG